MRFTLAPPPECGGLSELLAVVIARLAPGAPLGAWMPAVNLILAIASIGLMAALVRRATASRGIALVVALAMAGQAMFHSTLAPFAPLGELGAIAALGPWRVATAALVCLALVSPASTIVMAGFVLVGARYGGVESSFARRAMAAAALIAAGVVLQMMMPRLPPSPEDGSRLACLVPAVAAMGGRSLATAAMSGGPFVAALAALGAFSAWRTGARATWLAAAAFAIVPAVVSATLAPAFVVLWLAAALGLADAVRAARPSIGGRVASTVLMVPLPVLELPQAVARHAGAIDGPGLPDLGHGARSVDDMSEVLARLPDAAVVVEEDASTDVLLRALDGRWQKTGKRLARSAATGEAVAEALARSGGRVYTLPLAQSRLQWVGVEMKDAEGTGVAGLAEAARVVPCDALGERWTPASGLAGAAAFAVTSGDVRRYQGALIYVATSQPPAPAHAPWNDPADGTWRQAMYDLALDADRQRLDTDAAHDELAPEAAAALRASPFVVRLEVWRRGAARPTLGVTLGAPVVAAFARAVESTPGSALVICPSFPREVAPLAIR
jgi:hypothetical protein